VRTFRSCRGGFAGGGMFMGQSYIREDGNTTMGVWGHDPDKICKKICLKLCRRKRNIKVIIV